MPAITTDITVWKIWSAGGLSIVLPFKPTRSSANFDLQSSLLIGDQILQNIPAITKDRISVTRIQQKISSTGPLSYISSSLTNKILVPNRSKAEDQQTLHYQYIKQRDQSIDISYSSPWDPWSNSLENCLLANETPWKEIGKTEQQIHLIYTTKTP